MKKDIPPLASKEYMQRWAAGIKAVTPFQQARITYWNTYIMLFGLLAGIVITLQNWGTFWWLTIILIAAEINIIIVQIGNYQKYSLYRKMENINE